MDGIADNVFSQEQLGELEIAEQNLNTNIMNTKL